MSEEGEESVVSRIPPPRKRFWPGEARVPSATLQEEEEERTRPDPEDDPEVDVILTDRPAPRIRLVQSSGIVRPSPSVRQNVPVRAPSGLNLRDRNKPKPLTRARLDRIKQALMAGAYLETAASWAGIDTDQFRTYLRLAAEGHPKYRKLRRILQKAMVASELNDLRTISQTADGYPSITTRQVVIKHLDGKTETRTETISTTVRDWRASAWRLGRRNPERWARRLELSGAPLQELGSRGISLPDNGRDVSSYAPYEEIALEESDGSTGEAGNGLENNPA